jgi:hypothetical protein
MATDTTVPVPISLERTILVPVVPPFGRWRLGGISMRTHLPRNMTDLSDYIGKRR